MKTREGQEAQLPSPKRPALVKFSAKTRRQLETKITYQAVSNIDRYRVQLFLFTPADLTTVSSDLYSNLRSAVRLHTPKVTLQDLIRPEGAGGLLTSLQRRLDHILRYSRRTVSGGREVPGLKGLVRDAIWQLRLVACLFRSASRKAVKHFVSVVLSSPADQDVRWRMTEAAAAVPQLVEDVLRAVRHLQQVGSPCEQPQMPPEIQEEWLLIEEFVLFEGDRALLKLLREVDKFCQTVDSCVKEKLRSGMSATAQALHMRQQAYDALGGGQTEGDSGGAAATPPALANPLQLLGSQQRGRDASASGRRARQAAAGQVSSVDSALKEARSHSLDASSSPERESAAIHGTDGDDVTSVRMDAASVNTERTDAAAPARVRHAASARQHPEAALMAARKLVGHAIFGLEDERLRRGYHQSVLEDETEEDNEAYNYRIKLMKNVVRAAITLSLEVKGRSMLFDDIVGGTVAALAMMLACLTIIFAQTATRGTRYTLVFCIIMIAGYVVKDRLKEWGKRYIAYIASLFGVDFPDRRVAIRAHDQRVVGRATEKVKTTASSQVSERVLSIRHADKGPLKQQAPSVIPERVTVYTKEMHIRWHEIDHRLRGVDGLDDVLSIDLNFLIRQMQPPMEQQYRLWTSADGSFGVDKVALPRVYHVTLVLQLKGTDVKANDRATILQKVRVILDADGIKRLELDDPVDEHKAAAQPFQQATHQLRSRISALDPRIRHANGHAAASERGDHRV